MLIRDRALHSTKLVHPANCEYSSITNGEGAYQTVAWRPFLPYGEQSFFFVDRLLYHCCVCFKNVTNGKTGITYCFTSPKVQLGFVWLFKSKNLMEYFFNLINNAMCKLWSPVTQIHSTRWFTSLTFFEEEDIECIFMLYKQLLSSQFILRFFLSI